MWETFFYKTLSIPHAHRFYKVEDRIFFNIMTKLTKILQYICWNLRFRWHILYLLLLTDDINFFRTWRYARSLENANTTSYFFQLGFNMIGMTFTIFQVSAGTDKSTHNRSIITDSALSTMLHAYDPKVTCIMLKISKYFCMHLQLRAQKVTRKLHIYD